MKRILYIHHVSAIGGASYCLLNILKEVDRTVVIPVVLLRDDGPLVKDIRDLGIEVYFFPAMTQVPYNQSIGKFSTLYAYFKIINSLDAYKKIISKLNLDGVYINTMMLYPYLRPSKKFGLKTIVHIREHWPRSEHIIQLKWAQNEITKYADEVVAINMYSASLIPNRKTIIVYDWIDLDNRYKFIPLDQIFKENCANLKIFIYTGGELRIKGAKEVLEAFTKYLTNPEYRLLMVGINPQKILTGRLRKIKKVMYKFGIICYEYKIKDLIASDSRIHCIPATYMLKHILEQAYCNLSYFTIPHANLTQAECIIAGTPSIVADTEEAYEYSDNGYLSEIFKMNDFEDFVTKIKLIDSHYESLVRRIEEEKHIIKKKFDLQTNAIKLNLLYNSLFS